MQRLYYDKDQTLSRFIDDNYVSSCECPGYSDPDPDPGYPYLIGACCGLVIIGIAWLLE